MLKNHKISLSKLTKELRVSVRVVQRVINNNTKINHIDQKIVDIGKNIKK